MKSKQLVSKVAMLALVGTSILGSSSSLYAKSYTRVSYSKTSWVKPVKPNTGNTNNTGSNSCPNSGNTGSNNNTNSGSTGSNNNTNSGNTGSNNNTNSGNTGSNNNTNSGNTGSNNNTNTNTNTNVSTQTTYENKVLQLVNAERAKNGLGALTMDESVRKVARVKSSDMSANKYFSHTSPTYGSPFAMLKSYGISYKAAAENIAQGYTSPEAVVQGWMNSSGHRANILNGSYTKIGIGYEASGNYWTQMFIG